HHRFLPVDTWHDPTKRAVRRRLSSIAGELADGSPGYELACLSALSGLLTTLVREASTSDQSTAPPSAPSPRALDHPIWFERVRSIITYLQERYDHPISLDDLAAHVGLSRYYVSHLVKEATGLSLQENLGLIRTNRAIHLMFTTDERLVDIALDAGFSHLKYFTKYFKKLYGCAPSEVRERDDWRNSVLDAGAGSARSPSPELVVALGELA
ncbi:MAG: helix-turn-helix transcriptional regulator, partial [Spirochaetota bacterium]